MNRAVIDIGTNSVRLLIADVDDKGEINFRVRQVKTARLGEGITRGILKERAVNRTVEVLKGYKEIISGFPGSRVEVISTSVMRSVRNPELLLEKVKEELGWKVRIISGKEEARLSFLGAVKGLKFDPENSMVIDIGGGSTEIVSGTGNLISFSLPVGAVRLTEACGENIQCMKEKIKDQLNRNQFPVEHLKNILGVGGTISSLAMLDQGLCEYDFTRIHGYLLKLEKIRYWANYFQSLNPRERKQVKGLDPLRGEIILAGTLILQEVMEHFGFYEIRVSETYLLEGLIWSLDFGIERMTEK